MDKKTAAARPPETEPEDLHVPKHEPPSMPEAADKPDHTTHDRVADLAEAAPAGTGHKTAPRASGVPNSETEPEDLQVPKHEPPSMPEAADKPDRPAKSKSIGELR
jgi:hypothetical protein